MWCSFKRRNSSNKKKQDKENRVELDSKDHSIKKTSEEISLKIYNLSCMCR